MCAISRNALSPAPPYVAGMIPRVDHKSTQNTRGHRRGGSTAAEGRLGVWRAGDRAPDLRVIGPGSPPHDVVEEVIGVDLAELPLVRLGEVARGGVREGPGRPAHFGGPEGAVVQRVPENGVVGV